MNKRDVSWVKSEAGLWVAPNTKKPEIVKADFEVKVTGFKPQRDEGVTKTPVGPAGTNP